MKDLGRDRTFSIMSQIAKLAGFRVPVVHSPFVLFFSQALKNVKAILSPWVGFGQPASLQSPSLGVHQRTTTARIAWDGMECWLPGPCPGICRAEKQKSAIFSELLLPRQPHSQKWTYCTQYLSAREEFFKKLVIKRNSTLSSGQTGSTCSPLHLHLQV